MKPQPTVNPSRPADMSRPTIPGITKPGLPPALSPDLRPEFPPNGTPGNTPGTTQPGNNPGNRPGGLGNNTPPSAPATRPHVRPNWQGLVNSILQKNRRHWCHTRPTACRWWVSYCEPISHCHVNDIVVCNWGRVTCAPVIGGQLVAQEVQWYLGMKGMLLPGKGIGIEAVEPGSPAEQVGLQPGMVMTVANGIPLIDENAMNEAIRISGGILNMTLLSADGSQVLEGTVRMARVSSVSF